MFDSMIRKRDQSSLNHYFIRPRSYEAFVFKLDCNAMTSMFIGHQTHVYDCFTTFPTNLAVPDSAGFTIKPIPTKNSTDATT